MTGKSTGYWVENESVNEEFDAESYAVITSFESEKSCGGKQPNIHLDSEQLFTPSTHICTESFEVLQVEDFLIDTSLDDILEVADIDQTD